MSTAHGRLTKWVVLGVAATMAAVAMWGVSLPGSGQGNVAMAAGDEPSEEQQIANKVSHARSDMRTIATGLEAYYVDYNRYPLNTAALTTPIAYILPVPADPFGADGATYIYELADQGTSWSLRSVGPDGDDDVGETLYDPTNGTASDGDLVRVGQ